MALPPSLIAAHTLFYTSNGGTAPTNCCDIMLEHYRSAALGTVPHWRWVGWVINFKQKNGIFLPFHTFYLSFSHKVFGKKLYPKVHYYLFIHHILSALVEGDYACAACFSCYFQNRNFSEAEILSPCAICTCRQLGFLKFQNKRSTPQTCHRSLRRRSLQISAF